MIFVGWVGGGGGALVHLPLRLMHVAIQVHVHLHVTIIKSIDLLLLVFPPFLTSYPTTWRLYIFYHIILRIPGVWDPLSLNGNPTYSVLLTQQVDWVVRTVTWLT